MEIFDPHSSETVGYHLFLMPTGSVAEELSAIITALAEEYGGPVFPPHVTMLGRIQAVEDELLTLTKQLVSRMAPITLTLGELQSKDAYYKALYSAIVEQDILRAWHQTAARMFGMDPDDQYQAHLSLLYGNYPEERKAQTRAALTFASRSFVTDAIHLYKTAGTVDTWRRIAIFPFA